VSRFGGRGTVSHVVRRSVRGEEHGECDSDDHLVSGRIPKKQAGRLESKSMVSFAPNPIVVDRPLRGGTIALGFWVSLVEPTAPVISARRLFETFKQLVVIFAGAVGRLPVPVICERGQGAPRKEAGSFFEDPLDLSELVKR
jgi:hypothetical protein